MPAEVISTVHQLAAACKKAKGINFTNKDGNIIHDNNYSEEINCPGDNNAEVTGVNDRPCNAENENLEITGVYTTGVRPQNTQGGTAEEPENVQDNRGAQKISGQEDSKKNLKKHMIIPHTRKMMKLVIHHTLMKIKFPSKMSHQKMPI